MAIRSSAGIGLVKTVAGGDPLELVDHRLRLARRARGSSWSWAACSSRWARSSRLPARRASPSRSRTAAIRSRSGVEVGRLGLVGRSRSSRRAASIRTGIGRGDGGDGDHVLRRRRPREPLAELVEDRVAVGVEEAVLLVQDDDRPLPLPGQGRAAARTRSGSGRGRRRTGAGRPARRGRGPRPRASAPPSPISERPGVSVRRTVPSTPSIVVGVRLAVPGRPHRRPRSCRRAGRAGR